MKDGLVRAATVPLVFRVPGTESLPRGSHVRVRVAGADLLTLDLHAVLLARLDDNAAESAAAAADGDEDSDAAGPLTLTIEVDAAAAPEPATSG